MLCLRLRQAVLLLLLTVALTATSLAHRMPNSTDGSLALALANGMTLADLCASEGGSGGQHDRHCPACHLAATPGLPASDLALTDLELALPARISFPRESRAVARVLDPARSPQGPPTV